MVQTRSTTKRKMDELLVDGERSSEQQEKTKKIKVDPLDGDNSIIYENSDAKDDEGNTVRQKRAKTNSRGKRPKRTKGKTGARRGAKDKDMVADVPTIAPLAFMMKLPQDIFLDIATYLSPLDLLRMGRSSKTLRALLFSRSSKPFWRASRLNLPIPLPDGPEDLSEPLYAFLIFERGCSGCTCPNAKAYFALRKRFCKYCFKEYTGSPKYSTAELELGFDKLVPCTSIYAEAVTFADFGGSHSFTIVVMSDHRAMAERYQSAIQEGEEAAAKFRDERFEEIRKIMDHACQIDDWKREEAYIRKKARDALKWLRLRARGLL